MDSRHESYEQEIMNQFIHLVNQYLDQIVLNDVLVKHLSLILLYLYRHEAMNVDVKDFLSKENAFSIDPVFLPDITEIHQSKGSEKNTETFVYLINELTTLLQNKNIFKLRRRVNDMVYPLWH